MTLLPLLSFIWIRGQLDFISSGSTQSAMCVIGRIHTVYPKKYTHGFCFAVLCCGYTLTDYPVSIRLTSLALWQSNVCPSASKATLINMDKYFMWIHYEGLHNHNKAKHNKTVCIFLGIFCNKLKVVFHFMYATPFHYHLYADLLTCIEHMWWDIPKALLSSQYVGLYVLIWLIKFRRSRGYCVIMSNHVNVVHRF